MFHIEQSKLFIQQWKEFARNYNKHAGKNIAAKFILAVDAALLFIAENPYACVVYDAGEEVSGGQFRKWNLRGFPHLILFRIMDKKMLRTDAIYAHKMNLPARTKKDI